jgi:hypothetical protein
VIHRKNLSQHNDMKTTHSVWLSLYMRDNEKCYIPNAPSTGLSGTQFSTLNSAGIKVPEKYDNTEVKDQINIYTLKWSNVCMSKSQVDIMRNVLFMFPRIIHFSDETQKYEGCPKMS